MLLQPYPDPEGRYRVWPSPTGLRVLGPRDEPFGVVKRYEPHAPQCITPAKAVPQHRPEQLPLLPDGPA